MSQINCLNEQPDHDFKSIVASKNINLPESSTYLASDADGQLLINIHVCAMLFRDCLASMSP